MTIPLIIKKLKIPRNPRHLHPCRQQILFQLLYPWREALMVLYFSSLTNNLHTSTSKIAAIWYNTSKGGCISFVHQRDTVAYLFRQPKGRLIFFSKDCLDAVKFFLHGFLLLSAVKIRISLRSRVKNEINAYLSNALKDESNGKTNDNH